MKQALKLILQVIFLIGLTLPKSASAGGFSELEAKTQCLLEHGTLSQFVCLGMMLALVTISITLKCINRNGFTQADVIEKSESGHSAVEALDHLKIGEQFSDWSSFHRLARKNKLMRPYG